ncbi:MAG: amidohydrolase family protein [Clostridia bacterium]|nr:amidohydrolase family protein [Clostridia bacterium]
MEIIDLHCHVYPQKIASKASGAIGDFYNIKMPFDGTPESLLNEGEEAGVTRFVVHSVATTARQVESINDFLSEQASLHPQFIPFMTLHPDMTEREINSAVDAGIKCGFRGIKLHPDFQKFHADGKECVYTCAAAEGRIPVLFHAGDDRYDYSSPERIVRAANAFPHLTVIAAHFGAYKQWEKVPYYAQNRNIFFDTSSSLYYLERETAKRFIRSFGAERFMFGTDYPMWSAADEIKRLKELNLSEEEEALIFHKNAEKLLGLK